MNYAFYMNGKYFLSLYEDIQTVALYVGLVLLSTWAYNGNWAFFWTNLLLHYGPLQFAHEFSPFIPFCNICLVKFCIFISLIIYKHKKNVRAQFKLCKLL